MRAQNAPSTQGIKDVVHVVVLIAGLIGLMICLYIGRPAEGFIKPILVAWAVNAMIFAWRYRP